MHALTVTVAALTFLSLAKCSTLTADTQDALPGFQLRDFSNLVRDDRSLRMFLDFLLSSQQPAQMMGEPREDSDEGYRRKRSVNTSQEENVRKEENEEARDKRQTTEEKAEEGETAEEQSGSWWWQPVEERRSYFIPRLGKRDGNDLPALANENDLDSIEYLDDEEVDSDDAETLREAEGLTGEVERDEDEQDAWVGFGSPVDKRDFAFNPRLGKRQAFTPRLGKRDFAFNPRLGKRADFAFSPRLGKRDFAFNPRLGKRGGFAFNPRLGKRADFAFSPRLGKRGDFAFSPRLGKKADFAFNPRLGKKADFAFSPRLGKKDFAFIPRAGKRDFAFNPRLGKRADAEEDVQAGALDARDSQTASFPGDLGTEDFIQRLD
ncbi:uncharacterized protein LOC119583554 [Penaeus monodon]|uniref:uncharacterized protein LOC119583554 n=1 Tax=Penaeus monodon TaxID=6687 RepID=UPI0018A7D921|nr:uncharacterized protein LOC119583554 [Penaeus monodon]